MKKMVMFISVVLMTASCQNIYIDSIAQYNKLSPNIELGDEKADVLRQLQPAYDMVPIYSRKMTDVFEKDGAKIEIYYFYTTWQDDGITTDDEFTPYVFKNGKLLSIGWHSIGGVKTQAKPKAEIDINNYNYGGRYRDW